MPLANDVIMSITLPRSSVVGCNKNLMNRPILVQAEKYVNEPAKGCKFLFYFIADVRTMLQFILLQHLFYFILQVWPALG